ncbi:hypothetical protein Goari_027081 [Gossypium aridum]|uniref:Uncharacterized protein n=1 Tax=Gossypium aridum TaxID=34290 RepID=A0A7J8YRR1_GOSAI|nr:hypothetical protein [Gossypium aridum]
MTSSLAKVSSIEEMLREREQMRRLWVDQLKEAQDRMKYYAARHRQERQIRKSSSPNPSWVTLMSGTLTPKPTALALAPVFEYTIAFPNDSYVLMPRAVCAGTPTPSSGNMDSCVAGSASVAMPRKLDSLSTAEEFMLGRTLLEYEPLVM